jgi:hypothetical protein
MTKRISGRIAFLIIGVSVIIILLLGWFAFIAPQRSKVADLESQVSSAQTQIVDAQRLLSGPTRRQSLATVRQLQGVMPDQVKMSEILRQLSSISTTSEIELDTITPQTPSIVGGEAAVPLTVAITGHYFAIQRFLRLLRASADIRNGHLVATGRLYSVDSIQFTGGQVGGVISASLTLNGYVYTPLPSVAPATTTPASTSATAAGP